MPKRKCMDLARDLQDDEGKWLKHLTVRNHGRKLFTTRAGRVWSNISSRCLDGGSCQARTPAYIGCINGFDGFQEFAEWAQSQFGYMAKDCHGEFWHIDKDILLPGSKIYSPSTCMFVPQRINKLLLLGGSKDKELPIGVHRSGERGYRSVIRRGGKFISLGSFRDPVSAHIAWRKAKAENIEIEIQSADIKDHKLLTSALEIIARELINTESQLIYSPN